MGNFFSFIMNNLSHVAPILAAGGFAVLIVLERTKTLFWVYPFPFVENFFERIKNLVLSNRVADAVALCERYPEKPVAHVIKEGLLRSHLPENLIEHGLQIAVGKVSERIQAKTSFLATIANVATLLGLFGTILGLIQSFEAVGAANPQERSALLAQGISTAMNATMLGLGVAIPCMVAFAFLMNRTNRLNTQVEQAAVRTLDILKQKYYAADEAEDRVA